MATKKTNDKAVKEDVKKAVKETAAKTEKAVKETAKKAEKAVKETAAKTEKAVKETAAKTEKAAKKTAAKTEKAAKETVKKAEKTVKETAKKAASKKASTDVYFEFSGKQLFAKEIVEEIKSVYIAQGNKESSIKSLKVYVKAEDNAAYYVINDEVTGSISL